MIEIVSGGLDIWPHRVFGTEEPARFSIESQGEKLPGWVALARLVDSAALAWSLDGQVPGSQLEARPQRLLGAKAVVDSQSLSLVVQWEKQKSSRSSSNHLAEELQTLSVPLLGADVFVVEVEAEDGVDSSELPQCILGIAPRCSVSGLGDGGVWGSLEGSLDFSDEAWLFCVGCREDLPRLLDKLGHCGAIRWDFEEALERGKSLPQQLWVGGMRHHFARAAESSQLRRNVAVKSADYELSSFLSEMAVLVRFQSHPNIVRFHGAFAQPGQTANYLTFAFELHADTLHAAIEASGPFSQEKGCEIMVGLTSALSCLHRQRLVHRNVQNSTVLLDHHGQAVLSGFDGVACVDDFDAMNNHWGAPGFAAPEVVGLQAYGARADVFSAGVVFYCMLTCQHPLGYFTGANLKKIMKNTLKCKPSFDLAELDNLPASLLFIIRSMLSKNPKARPLLAHAYECCRACLPDELRKKHGSDGDEEEELVVAVATESVLEVQTKMPKLPKLVEVPSGMEQSNVMCDKPPCSQPQNQGALSMTEQPASASDGTLFTKRTHQCPAPEGAVQKRSGRSMLRYLRGAMCGAKASLLSWRKTTRDSSQVAPAPIDSGFSSLVPTKTASPMPAPS